VAVEVTGKIPWLSVKQRSITSRDCLQVPCATLQFWGLALGGILVLHSQMCSTKQCLRQQQHMHLEKIPYLLHGLLSPWQACSSSARKMRLLVVICTSNALLKFNTLGKFLPSAVVKLPNLRYKTSHNAIISSETLNSNHDDLAEST